MATIVQYNDVTLYNVITRKWDEEIFYDASGTDEIGKRYSFTFQGVLHTQRIPITSSEVFVSSGDTSVDSGLNNNGVFDLLTLVKNKLNHPRKKLVIAFGTVNANTVALTIEAGTGSGSIGPNIDIDNGPKPKAISITPVGTKAFRVVFSVDAIVGTCDSKTRNGENIVISNRWSISESMDSNYYVTRRITGQMRLAAGVFGAGTSSSGAGIATGFPGHAQKDLTIPPLEGGFKRDGILFTCTPDGLTCTYEVIDRQVHTAAPWPATKISGSHTEGTQYGTYFSSEMRVQLIGDPACDKRLLIERAIQVLDARLGISILTSDNQAFIEAFQITDTIGEEAVIEAYARVNRTQTVGETGQLNPFFGALGRTLTLPPISVKGKDVTNTNYDYQLSRVPSLYGYKASEPGPDHERRPAVLFFLHCYLQNPCDDVHDVGPGNPTAQPPSAPEPRRESPPSTYETPPGSLPYEPDSDTYSESTKANLYTIAEVSSEYKYRSMVVGLPIANSEDLSENPNTQPLTDPFRTNRPAQTKVVHLAKGQCKRIHRVNLERIGALPEIPYPQDTYTDYDTTGTLESWDSEWLPPVRSPDGNQAVYRVIATYVYILDKPPLFGSWIPIEKNPAFNISGFNEVIHPNFSGTFGTIPASSGPASG